jgi:hypothetical protein
LEEGIEALLQIYEYLICRGKIRTCCLKIGKGRAAELWRLHHDNRLIHANGHTMSVAYEDTKACIARILAQGGGPVTHRRRVL